MNMVLGEVTSRSTSSHALSQRILQTNHKIVSGFGLGVGNAVISGALEQIYMNPRANGIDQLILRPFLNRFSDQLIGRSLATLSEDMTSYAGIALFLIWQ